MHIQNLALATKDIRQQLDFYARVLEFPIVAETPLAFSVQIGSSTLTFEQDEAFTGFYHFAFDIPHNQVEDAERWLRTRVNLLSDAQGRSRFPPSGNWNTTNLYFDDAGGNIAEFIARHNLGLEHNAPFGSQAVLRISEIGVVVPDVPVAMHDFENQYGLRAFNGSSDTFTALGGHDGMLIVVKLGRGWFPVGRPSVPATFQMTAVQNGHEFKFGQP
jgi:catechol-2,3-dioxygenase